MGKKIVIIVISIILVIIVTIGAGYITFKKIRGDVDSNTVDNTIVENKVSQENLVNENTIEENKVEETSVKPEQSNTNVLAPSDSVYETDTDLGTTDRKQEAINLVKQSWGEDSTVTFRCDEVTKDGEYIIAVISLQSASVKNYFKVNLETKSVEVEY